MTKENFSMWLAIAAVAALYSCLPALVQSLYGF